MQSKITSIAPSYSLNGEALNGISPSRKRSSASAVSVRGVSKRYTIFHDQTQRDTFIENLLHRARKPVQRREKEEFWALRDIDFDIGRGEVVGIIGHNGAGKSTLLKILSRITSPTSGEINLWGRVGSLLEVGTGFHPELTGRENIFLNGSILGMSRREIERHFDAIVDFAETEKFLDTPVKRYSSGMYVRLAFAVAAHLNPEILVVDEVLAVGDSAFQQKCLGKMSDVAHQDGRTVLFVSHNLAAVRQLCSRAILLQHGQLMADGEVEDVLHVYRQSFLGKDEDGRLFWSWPEREDAPHKILSIRGVDHRGQELLELCTWQPVTFEITIQSEETIGDAGLELAFDTQDEGTRLLKVSTKPFGTFDLSLSAGEPVTVRVHFPNFPLGAGNYQVMAGLTRPLKGFLTDDMVMMGNLNVSEAMVWGGTRPMLGRQSYFTCPHEWSVSA